MAKKEGMMGCCMHKAKGIGMVILGLLILGNVYWEIVDWPMFWGWILIILGALKIFMPHQHYMK
jgi:uncharacterized membrane protein HdeD (DUF308 family)